MSELGGSCVVFPLLPRHCKVFSLVARGWCKQISSCLTESAKSLLGAVKCCLLLGALWGASDGWMGASSLQPAHFLHLLHGGLVCPFGRVRKVNQFGSRAGLETTSMKNTRLDSVSWNRSSPDFKVNKIFSISPVPLPAPSSSYNKEFDWCLSLVLWREPLNPWNFPSDRNFCYSRWIP